MICGVLAAAGTPSWAQTGVIRGQVELPRVAAPVARRPDVRGLGMPLPRPEATRHRSVVYLEAASGEAFEDSNPRRVLIDQRSETFVPHLVAVTAGTEVDFPNSDETYHNVFSLSRRCGHSTWGVTRRGAPGRCGSSGPASSASSATFIPT